MKNNLLPGQLTNTRYNFNREFIRISVYIPISHFVFDAVRENRGIEYNKAILTDSSLSKDSKIETSFVKMRHNRFIVSSLKLNYKTDTINLRSAHAECNYNARKQYDIAKQEYEEDIKNAMFNTLK